MVNAVIGRHCFVYLLGPEANKFVFANADAFSWRETFQDLVPIDGPTALIVSDGEDHRRRRSVVAPGLRHQQIQDYMQTMVSTVDAMIDGWRPAQQLDLFQYFRSAVRRGTAEIPSAAVGPGRSRLPDFAALSPRPGLTVEVRESVPAQ